ncbi:MAG: GNAT family N-acetyltransferase [Defluviitaleaceae bacterium]|nr:GNAT family N-acetyltransferase [Defluviitaleaceae bacterium]
MVEIKELPIDKIGDAYPVARQLRTHLSLCEFVRIANEMSDSGYRAACLYENGEIVSYVGYAERTNMYYGRHVWVYELVTDETKRSRGYGRLLLDFVGKLAVKNSCSCVALSSGLQRKDAHRFYEDAAGFKKISYIFKKDLN